MTAVPPQPTLTDGDLTLRPWRREDLDLVDERSAEELNRSLAPAEAVNQWHRQYADSRAVVNFAIELAGEHGPVGTVEVRRTGAGVGDVSWTTFRPYRRRKVAQRAVRMLVAYAFGELGLERLQAEIDPDNHASARVAIRIGFRREGLLRGSTATAGERRDSFIYGLRRGDPAPDTVLGWTSVMDSLLPKKRVIAHVVIRDPAGRVLLCQVSYKRELELPGGVVEPGEDPATGALREVQEELGIDLPLGDVVAIDWLPPWQGWGDAIEILYDGGRHDPDLIDRLKPDGREIVAVGWYGPDELDGLVSPLNLRRLPLVLAEPDEIHQLRDGRPLT